MTSPYEDHTSVPYRVFTAIMVEAVYNLSCKSRIDADMEPLPRHEFLWTIIVIGCGRVFDNYQHQESLSSVIAMVEAINKMRRSKLN